MPRERLACASVIRTATNSHYGRSCASGVPLATKKGWTSRFGDVPHRPQGGIKGHGCEERTPTRWTTHANPLTTRPSPK